MSSPPPSPSLPVEVEGLGSFGPALRPYQEAALAAVGAAWRSGRRRVIVHLPTGTGKTILGLDGARRALARGRRVLWLAHTDELIGQPERTARELGLDPGVVKAERDELGPALTIASVQTIGRVELEKRVDPDGSPLPPLAHTPRLDRAAAAWGAGPALIVVDETHHATAATYRRILERWPDAYALGLTATVERTDGRSLEPAMPGGIVYSYPIPRAIEEEYLVPFVPHCSGLALSWVEIPVRGGDYGQTELALVLDQAGVTRYTVDAYLAHAPGKKCLVFCASVALSKVAAAAFCDAGVPAEHLCGDTPTERRRAILRRFHSGETMVVSSCMVLTEGFDEPSIEAIIMARPTQSKPLYVQMLGRGLRPWPGKEHCIVVDIVQNTASYDVIQAPMLIERIKPEKPVPGAVAPKRPKYKHAPGERAWAHWVDVPGVGRASSGRGRLLVVLREVADGHEVHVWQDQNHQILSGVPVHEELALGWGDDIIRRSGGGSVARRKAAWRKQEASQKQIEALAKWHVKVDSPLTAGEAADLLTAKIARSKMASVPRYTLAPAWTGRT